MQRKGIGHLERGEVEFGKELCKLFFSV